MRIRNILVPLDGTALSEVALPFAEAIAARDGARLTLIRDAHTGGLVGGNSAVDQRRSVDEAEDYLRSIADTLTTRGISVETGVPFGGNPAKWIAEEVRVRKADMIVMATHARVGPDRWLHGSVAEAVVQRTSVPVLLVREAVTQKPSPALV